MIALTIPWRQMLFWLHLVTGAPLHLRSLALIQLDGDAFGQCLMAIVSSPPTQNYASMHEIETTANS
eukprot:5043192-Pleurochrysis_carterae.AAC.2